MFTLFPENSDLTPSKQVKFGIDPTFKRLHLGHMVPLRICKSFKQQHQVTIVLGTFTAQLGDSSGRDQTRPILDASAVESNSVAIEKQIRSFLGTGFLVHRNGNCFNHMKLGFFMNLASKFTVTHMLSRDSFQNRSVALHELLVPICQGWDSVNLKTEIEIGGQDQLFNFQIARKLQEMHGQKPQVCLMLPIINGTDGKKMSKSSNNCIFMDESPEEIFGKVMSISDKVMEEWFPLLTDCKPVDHPMESKKILAFDIVLQLYGKEKAVFAKDYFEKVIQYGEIPENKLLVTAGMFLMDAIRHVRKCSKSEARRLMEQGAVSIDGFVTDRNDMLLSDQVVKVGKRDFIEVA
jgi:tyrosyl-tRNA synthetase